MKIKKNIAISESGFVFDPTTGESYSLNPIGKEILEMLKDEKSIDEIHQIITDQYEIDRGSFEKYFYDFTATLKYFDLVENNGENES